jgi:Uma2 family endonuclease
MLRHPEILTVSHISTDRLRMSFGEFVAFLDTRPDEEKWELVDGMPVLSPSPVYVHQIVVSNLIVELASHLRSLTPRQAVIPGIGVRIDEFNAPVPDVMIRPLDSLDGSFCDDMSVAFEVLSPGTARRDRRWKRQVYAALPALQHYVIISPKAVDITVFNRADGFEEHRHDDGLEHRSANAGLFGAEVVAVRARAAQVVLPHRGQRLLAAPADEEAG